MYICNHQNFDYIRYNFIDPSGTFASSTIASNSFPGVRTSGYAIVSQVANRSAHSNSRATLSLPFSDRIVRNRINLFRRRSEKGPG